MLRASILLSITIATMLLCTDIRAAHAADVGQLIASLKDAHPDVRISAFYALRDVGFTTSDQIKLAIINLLSTETAFITKPTGLSGNAGEAYRDYFGDLSRTVASFDDVRAINALVGVIDSGQTVTRALAAFGVASLVPVIAQASSSDPRVRQGTAMALSEMIESNAVSDAAAKTKIRETLNTLSTDSDVFVGLAAIEGLMAAGGATISGPVKRVSIDIKPDLKGIDRDDKKGSQENAARHDGGNGGGEDDGEGKHQRRVVINLRSDPLLPVAILSDKNFDAAKVDSQTVTFGPGKAPVRGNPTIQEVNGDGLPDMVVHFETKASGIACSDKATFLAGKTVDGTQIVGSQAITVVGCEKENEPGESH